MYDANIVFKNFRRRAFRKFVISRLTTKNPANNFGYDANAVIEQRQSLGRLAFITYHGCDPTVVFLYGLAWE